MRSLGKSATEGHTARTSVLLTVRGSSQRAQGRCRALLAADARLTSCNVRTLWCRDVRALDPGQELPEREIGIDPDNPETTGPKTGGVAKPLGVPPCKGCIATACLSASKAQ